MNIRMHPETFSLHSTNSDEFELEKESKALSCCSRTMDNTEWQTTLEEKVLPTVVWIHRSFTKSFDTERASSGQATGFIVDAKRGLILTNRVRLLNT